MKTTKQSSAVSDELIDEWLKQGRKPEDISGLLKEFTRRVVERALQGEMAEHLSPRLISDVTDGVREQARIWQNRLRVSRSLFYEVPHILHKQRHNG